MRYRSFSSKETKRLGKELWIALSARKKSSRSMLIALTGGLGSGKTTFVQGFLRAAGIRGRVTSPTFVLSKRFVPKNGRWGEVYHIDAYRLRGMRDARAIGLPALLRASQTLLLVEWPERLGKNLPRPRVRLRFDYGKHPDARIITSHGVAF